MPLGLRSALVAAIALLAAAPASALTHSVREGRVTFSFLPGQLRSLGMEAIGTARPVSGGGSTLTGLEPPLFSFAVESSGLSFRTVEGRLDPGEAPGAGEIRAMGGLTLSARDPRTGAALPPAQLYDFRVDASSLEDGAVRLLAPGSAVPAPLEVRNARVGLD
ncbi:MAG TPA: hypothetical protein VKU85_02600, partial [bacterium]|nr:hypothetical protein [bacterium]